MRDGCFYLICSDLLPESQAEAMGLARGSVLQAIDGVAIERIHPESIQQCLKKRPLQLHFSAPMAGMESDDNKKDEDVESLSPYAAGPRARTDAGVAGTAMQARIFQRAHVIIDPQSPSGVHHSHPPVPSKG